MYKRVARKGSQWVRGSLLMPAEERWATDEPSGLDSIINHSSAPRRLRNSASQSGLWDLLTDFVRREKWKRTLGLIRLLGWIKWTLMTRYYKTGDEKPTFNLTRSVSSYSHYYGSSYIVLLTCTFKQSCALFHNIPTIKNEPLMP